MFQLPIVVHIVFLFIQLLILFSFTLVPLIAHSLNSLTPITLTICIINNIIYYLLLLFLLLPNKFLIPSLYPTPPIRILFLQCCKTRKECKTNNLNSLFLLLYTMHVFLILPLLIMVVDCCRCCCCNLSCLILLFDFCNNQKKKQIL